MDEEIDHLKLYEEAAQSSLAGPVTLLTGLDEVRAHQRGEVVGSVERKKPGRPAISEEKRFRILAANGTLREVAREFKVSQSVVFNIRAAINK
jgi:hypothetical protein